MGSSGTPPWASPQVARRRRASAKPPSRWKLAHPTISIRVTEAQRQVILKARKETGRRLGDLVWDGIRGAQDSYWRGYQSGYLRGSNDGFASPVPIVVPCHLCGRLIPGDAKDPAFLGWVKNGANGGHPGCSGCTNIAPSP
jgi:hypothetical protein